MREDIEVQQVVDELRRLIVDRAVSQQGAVPTIERELDLLLSLANHRPKDLVAERPEQSVVDLPEPVTKHLAGGVDETVHIPQPDSLHKRGREISRNGTQEHLEGSPHALAPSLVV